MQIASRRAHRAFLFVAGASGRIAHECSHSGKAFVTRVTRAHASFWPACRRTLSAVATEKARIVSSLCSLPHASTDAPRHADVQPALPKYLGGGGGGGRGGAPPMGLLVKQAA
jgi:hypothetical protein